jgi:ribose transport system ATP-binding protein
MRDCAVLLFDEPTRGIDVGAKFEIYGLLDQLAESGKAIVMVSSDLRELMAVCDRIAVMSAGRLVETFARGHWSEDRILSAALSGTPDPCLLVEAVWRFRKWQPGQRATAQPH